jgi:hypothetical protein
MLRLLSTLATAGVGAVWLFELGTVPLQAFIGAILIAGPA